jgi:hypothetical protein
MKMVAAVTPLSYVRGVSSKQIAWQCYIPNNREFQVDNGSGYSGSNKAIIDEFRSAALAQGYIPYAAHRNRELNSINAIAGVK